MAVRAVAVRAVAVRAVAAGVGLRRHRCPRDNPRLQPRHLIEPARDPVRRVGVAQHQASLLAGQAPGQVPCEGANRDHAREQQRPDPDGLVTAELAIDDQIPSQPDQERVERRNPEQGGDLVECRLLDQVLIAVVQSRDLSDHEHQRKREQGKGVEGVVAQDRHTDQNGDRRRSDVREREGAAVDRIPPIGRIAQTALGDLVLSALVARREPAGPEVGEGRERPRRIVQFRRSAYIRLRNTGIQLYFLFGHRRPLRQTTVVGVAGRACTTDPT